MARVGERRCAYKVLMGIGKGPLGRLGIDGRIILKSFFRSWNWDAWSGLIWLRIGTGDGPL